MLTSPLQSIDDSTAFVYKTDPSQVGSGLYQLVACFLTLGICVPFTIEVIRENEELKEVDLPILLGPQCFDRQGHLEDFSKPHHESSYDRTRVLSIARQFVEKLSSSRPTA
ncbi:MAG: hypothetical protein KA034_01915 [Candidatus Moranbacteria bacterium]|nr:hypothetical protein [Candidatus Moranbacteria bacterium]